MMGAGKSAVGEVLAKSLGWRRVDTDQLVEERAQMSVAEFFSAHGEEAFREAESAVIASLCDDPAPLVVSVGGGAVMRAANREAMRKLGTVVWLQARAETLLARVGSGEGRPLLVAGGDGGARSRLVELAQQRTPFYEQVADLVIETDALSPDEVAGKIARELALCKKSS
jgi:shikimate kinase